MIRGLIIDSVKKEFAEADELFKAIHEREWNEIRYMHAVRMMEEAQLRRMNTAKLQLSYKESFYADDIKSTADTALSGIVDPDLHN